MCNLRSRAHCDYPRTPSLGWGEAWLRGVTYTQDTRDLIFAGHREIKGKGCKFTFHFFFLTCFLSGVSFMLPSEPPHPAPGIQGNPKPPAAPRARLILFLPLLTCRDCLLLLASSLCLFIIFRSTPACRLEYDPIRPPFHRVVFPTCTRGLELRSRRPPLEAF